MKKAIQLTPGGATRGVARGAAVCLVFSAADVAHLDRNVVGPGLARGPRCDFLVLRSSMPFPLHGVFRDSYNGRFLYRF